MAAPRARSAPNGTTQRDVKPAAVRRRITEAGRRRALRRPIPFRPTLRALVVLAVGAACLLLGSQTASEALVAGSLACVLALAAALISVLAGRVATGRTPAPIGSAETTDGSPIRRLTGTALKLIAAPAIGDTTIWEQVDQHGRAVRTLEGDQPPRERGLYRSLETVITCRDVFGFWIARRTLTRRRELWVPPKARTQPSRALQDLLARRSPFALTAQRERSSALVRPYEQGDPLRAVSWKATAHHGTLMSFEHERTERVLPLIAIDAATPGDIDAIAEEAADAFARISSLRGARGAVRICDGTTCAAGEQEAMRLLASLQADPPDGVGQTPGAQEQAAAIARQARLGGHAEAAPIVLIASASDTPLSRALRKLPEGRALTVLVAQSPRHRTDASGQRDTVEKTAPRRGTRQKTPALPRPDGVSDVLSWICCLILIALTVRDATALIEPSSWQTVGAGALAAAATAATVARRIPGLRRGIGRAAALVGAGTLIPIACIVAAASLLHAQTGIDVLVPRASLAPLGIDAQGDGLGWIAPVLIRGIEELYFGQWVPVSVSAVSDAALAIAAAPLAVLLMALMASRRARALLACLPLALSATRFCFLGTPGHALEVGATLACGLALLALGIGTAEPGEHDASASRPALARRAIRPLALRAPALIACAAISWCACVLAPRATVASQAIPVDFGLQSNVLSGSSVSPVMDLKRDLVRPQTTTALTYWTDSNEPLYLKLAVLDNLSSDTWLLSTADAGAGSWSLDALFGGASAANPALPGDNPQLTPLEAAVEDGDWGGAGTARRVETTVSIDGLTSRFAPLPIGALATRTDDAAQAGDWTWGDTGTVSGTDSSTYRGQLYTVTAAYVEPIGSVAELGDALSLNARALAQRFDELADATGNSARERCLALPDRLPTGVQAVIDQAHEQGVAETCETLADERAALAFLLDYFSDERFAYDLDAPDGDGRDNMQVVEDFLESGRGYCLHYASAMTVLSRALGVPARLVLGYRASDARASNGSYLVTNRDLHAWTEVYLDGVGWLPLDVTPAQASGTGQAAHSADEPDEAPDDPREPIDTERENEQEQPGDDGERADSPGSQGSTASDTANTGWFAAAARFAKDRLLPIAVPVGTAVLLVAAPFVMRRAVHAARMRAIARAEVNPRRAAEAAWAEVRTRARRLGARWDAAATEEDIARAAIAYAPESAQGVEYVMRAVCLARYGGDGTRSCTPDELIAALDPARWPRRACGR